MKTSEVIKELSNIDKDEEVICVWFTKDDFPLGLSDDYCYETLPSTEWNEVVSRFESTKWDNPLSSSWTEVHKDIYHLVGERLNANV